MKRRVWPRNCGLSVWLQCVRMEQLSNCTATGVQRSVVKAFISLSIRHRASLRVLSSRYQGLFPGGCVSGNLQLTRICTRKGVRRWCRRFWVNVTKVRGSYQYRCCDVDFSKKIWLIIICWENLFSSLLFISSFLQFFFFLLIFASEIDLTVVRWTHLNTYVINNVL
jgi:hypothetical protein